MQPDFGYGCRIWKSSIENYVPFKLKFLERLAHGIKDEYKIINPGCFKDFSDIFLHGTEDDAAVFTQKGFVGFKNYT